MRRFRLGQRFGFILMTGNAFQAMLTDALAHRLGVDPTDDLRPALYAAVGMAVVRTATDRWLVDPDRLDLAQLVHAGFAALPGPTS